jgi:hypothetical protein
MRIRLGLLALCGGMAMLAGAHAADIQTRDAPDLTGVRAAIKAKNYDSALAQLKPIVATSSHPDVLSLMGFALRKTGDRAQSMVYYRRALEADPTHKGGTGIPGRTVCRAWPDGSGEGQPRETGQVVLVQMRGRRGPERSN